jgi:hypothetical protein
MDKEKTILKRLDAQFVFSHITKEMGVLQDSTDIVKKKEAILDVYGFIVNERPALRTDLVQEILISFNKQFIKTAFYDPIEKCREYSLKILI